MRTEVIRADTIDVVVEKILIELATDTTSSTRENTIYFDGWDRLGASAVLEAVAERLVMSNESETIPPGLDFDNIIHIDCSKWEGRRSLQRKIAEQLKLPNWVMEIFEKQDEEDDFNGLDQASRGEIVQIVRETYQTTKSRRFLVILHNGSNEEINIFNFGLSLYGYANSKMLWTFQGRFRLDPKMIDTVKKSTTTHVHLSAARDGRDAHELWSYLVGHEAAQIFSNKHGHGIIDPAIAAECVLYMLKQCCISSHTIDHDWAIHTSNYWVCDRIIALPDIDKAWHVGDILQQEVRLLDSNNQLSNDESTIIHSSHLARSTELMPYWITTSTCGFVRSSSGLIPNSIFQHSNMLGVLKLSRCRFRFASPPFLCCHNLRFLWLDHCQDILTRSSMTDHHHTDADKEELENITSMSWECFQSLWVLDLRYTDWVQILSARVMDLMTQLRELIVMGARNWDMSHLRGHHQHNIRKLRVTKSTCYFNNNIFSEMESLEILDFSGNIIRQGMTSLCGLASNSKLNTVTIDGCDGLKNISLRGCKELKNLFLKGSLGKIEEMDFSGTRLKTLDLGGVETTSIPKQLILLGCEKLMAVLWPKTLKEYEWSGVLRIDTTLISTSAEGGEAQLCHPHGDRSLQQQKDEIFRGGWHISFMDARFFTSIFPVRGYLYDHSSFHLDIYTVPIVGPNQGTSSYIPVHVQAQLHGSVVMDSGKYKDVLKDGMVPAVIMWDCPKLYSTPWMSNTCIMKVIMHGQGNKLLEHAPSSGTSDLLLPGFICDYSTSLHVYDNSSITTIFAHPSGSDWNSLKWCRVERCPKLQKVFANPHSDSRRVEYPFSYLQTFWASHLLTARCIWGQNLTADRRSFYSLSFLHLEYCPRLVHVLPLNINKLVLGDLETIEIVYCGDLTEVFPLRYGQEKRGKSVTLFKLRRIHLHELPKLQSIVGCGVSIYAPNLESMKIRGCWSLRRLPVLGSNTKPPKVDCEKEWWDKLEWDGVEANHHPSLYQPSHSPYYKA